MQYTAHNYYCYTQKLLLTHRQVFSDYVVVVVVQLHSSVQINTSMSADWPSQIIGAPWLLSFVCCFHDYLIGYLMMMIERHKYDAIATTTKTTTSSSKLVPFLVFELGHQIRRRLTIGLGLVHHLQGLVL